ncbi:MAG: hypothetical protein MK100_00310 [Phycisphaerales bacterium]|nr:hypothetical protein [Phycisphaerales bacterium]
MLTCVLFVACVLIESSVPMGETPERASISAPPIIIHHIHEDPIDIVLAWHASPTRKSALSPPLRSVSAVWNGDQILESGRIGTGDRIVRGALKNEGQTEIFILTTAGEVLVISGGDTLWVGDPATLRFTHRCACECICGLDDVVLPCGKGSCGMNGVDCIDFSGNFWRLRKCRQIYLPIQPAQADPRPAMN